ncbi:MAG TPA: hypothetical protein VFB78_05765 [Acidimicrobiales bacterium]|nr:hypothetical protein [Acidimicrobiales bacterium]
MYDKVLAVYVWQRTARSAVWQRAVIDERGEGVISAAIAVLIMAFLGVLMWVGFKATLGNAQGNVDNQVNQIGK